jgi:hypothetical protein
MTTLREAAQQALEALTTFNADDSVFKGEFDQEITALRTALAKPEQEPVAWQERLARRVKDGVVTEWSGWYECRYRTVEEARAEVCDHIPYEWRPLYTHPIDDTALLRQALEALEFESSGYCGGEQTEKALTALRERLEAKA